MLALCERSLVAMARGQWSQAEVHSERAWTALRRAAIEESYATPLVCAVLCAGHTPAVRQELVTA